MPPSSRLKSAIIAAIILSPAIAQNAPPGPKPRPTIGLALEGGGALALAHVGLIEWFEQHHIPIDYIAGTSMGGLVGGFYASGMTAPEMRRKVDSLNWSKLVNGQFDYRNLAFRRKEDARALGNTSVLGLRHGLFVPSGLNSGQELDLLLGEIALPYGQTKTFDDLPTPFRTVATDLVTSRQHVFDSGPLDLALRATMSIPARFQPVLLTTGGKTEELVDGGLLNNFPVDLVKSMGADIVIAVSLVNDPYDPNQPHTAIDVLERSVSAVMEASERRNREMADVLVAMNLVGFTASDFSKAGDIMQRGLEAGATANPMLTKFALDDPSWLAYLQRRETRRKSRLPTPEFVTVEVLDDPRHPGQHDSLAHYIGSYFDSQIGKPLERAALDQTVRSIMGMGLFAHVSYAAIERDGTPGLAVYVHRSQGRPPTLQPAVGLDGANYLNTRFSFSARITQTGLGGFRSEWRSDIAVGSTYGIRSEYFHPFTPLSKWFVAPRAVAETRPLDFYSRTRIVAIDRVHEVGGGVDLGYSIGNTGEVRLGYDAAHLRTLFRAGDASAFPILGGRYGAAHLSFTHDRVDDEIVPHAGLLARANFRWIHANPGSLQQLPVLDGRATMFKPLGDRNTVFTGIEGGTVFNRANAGLPFFFLGGPQRLSAYGTNELFGNQFVYSRVGFMKQINASAPLTDGRVYLVTSYEVGKMSGARNSTAVPMDANAGVLVRTIAGPLFLGGSVGDSGHHKWYFQLGRFF